MGTIWSIFMGGIICRILLHPVLGTEKAKKAIHDSGFGQVVLIMGALTIAMCVYYKLFPH